ncbi:hypothetical protein [Bacteroides sp. AM16-24]|uniref:hypothetical protein n=1 Tax=Bacteroides sp. AM16-24 TaxID=2292002 RepID=UPI001F2A053A|nr:hypothetical protein [Bacteroides sp. AM16-24]
MEIEVINGQIIAKANHYQAVPGRGDTKRIIKDEVIRAYERSFIAQCKTYRDRRISSRFRLFVKVWHSSPRFDLDNSLKTLLGEQGVVVNLSNDYSQLEKTVKESVGSLQKSFEKNLKQIRHELDYKNISSRI